MAIEYESDDERDSTVTRVINDEFAGEITVVVHSDFDERDYYKVLGSIFIKTPWMKFYMNIDDDVPERLVKGKYIGDDVKVTKIDNNSYLFENGIRGGSSVEITLHTRTVMMMVDMMDELLSR